MSAETCFEEPAPFNPLDIVEDVLASNNWAFSRMNEDELTVTVNGDYCSYRLFFLWQEDLSALQFCCQYGFDIQGNPADISASLRSINEKIWMGHFDVPDDTMKPTFRQTSLLRGMMTDIGSDLVHDLVDIALTQCERHYHMFKFLAQPPQISSNIQDISLALMETVGES